MTHTAKAMETTVRELVTLGDTCDHSALDLVAGLRGYHPGDSYQAARGIIITNMGDVTEDTIDELIEFMDNDDDDWNE